MSVGLGIKILFAGAFLLVAVGVGVLIYAHHLNHRFDKLSDSHDLQSRIEKLAKQYSDKHSSAALMVAVYQRGKRYARGFGETSQSNRNPPDRHTMFEIGSITKVFTAVALAKLAGEGVVKLEDPINLYLPKDIVSPKRNGREITLLDLATHTSGLPRLPGNLMASVKDPQNPYQNYQATNLYEDLATVKLASDPGKKSSYSNYGFGLLGHLLELKTATPYETLIQKTICAPLGMSNTVVRSSPEQKMRLAEGHDSKGKVVPGWDLAVLAGCGALRSDAEDMLKFAEANLSDDSPLSTVLAETQKVRFKGWIQGVGLGWQIEILENPILHWHNGGTGGYRSFLGLNRTNQIAIVVLASSEHSVDDLAMEILKLGSKISLE